MLQIAWKDNALVLFLTTFYTGSESQQRLRRCPTSTQPRAREIKRFFAGEPVKTVEIPSIAADYNDHMNAVDIGDHLRSATGYKHRICRGGWQALAWNFLYDVSPVNSYLLQLRGEPIFRRCKSQLEWREQLIDELFEAYGKTGGSRQRYQAGDEVTLLSQHKFVQRGKKSRCLACQGISLESFGHKAHKSLLGPCLTMPSIAGKKPVKRVGAAMCVM